MAGNSLIKELRKSEQAVRLILDQLDRETGTSSRAQKREKPRFEYRHDALVVEVERDSSAWVRLEVMSRNISAGGMAFLTNRYIYEQKRCRVHLVSLDGKVRIAPAIVAHCQYIEGSGNVYLIGVRFEQDIDVERLSERATNARLLIVDHDAVAAKLVRSLLKRTSAIVMHAENTEVALGHMEDADIDLVLVNLDGDEATGLAVASDLRKKGFVGTLLAMCSNLTVELHQRILAAGFTGFFQNPITRDALEAVLISTRGEAVVSSLAGDPDLVPLIDEFLTALRQRLQELEASFVANDTAGLSRLARQLRSNAGSLGFECIVDAAAELEAAVGQGADATAMRRSLNEVARLCRAARPIS